MKIRMLSSAPGSVDGCQVARYAAGQEYDLSGTTGERDLAAAFVSAELAEPVDMAPAQEAAPVAADVAAEATSPAHVRRAPRAKK